MRHLFAAWRSRRTPPPHRDRETPGTQPGDETSSEPPQPRFRLLTTSEVLALPDPEWLIESMLPEGALAQLYGESGLGKSFITLDLALSVAAGRPWLERFTVQQGPVVYVAAEGHVGMKKRIAAWLEYHSAQEEELGDFRLIGEPLPLGERKDVQALIELSRETFDQRDHALIVLDTQARCTEGLDENAAKEMGLAVAAADTLKRETGATVLLVHHSGYAGDHARGSTTVKAALDSQAKLDGKRGSIQLLCKKQKDAEEFEPIEVALLPVADSLVCVAEDDPTKQAAVAKSRLTPKQQQAYEALLYFRDEGLTHKDWLEISELPPSTFNEALKALKKCGLVVQSNDRYFVVDPDGGSNPVQSQSNGPSSDEVQKSTPPKGGGPVDREASHDWEGMPRATEAAWEDSRDESS